MKEDLGFGSGFASVCVSVHTHGVPTSVLPKRRKLCPCRSRSILDFCPFTSMNFSSYVLLLMVVVVVVV